MKRLAGAEALWLDLRVGLFQGFIAQAVVAGDAVEGFARLHDVRAALGNGCRSRGVGLGTGLGHGLVRQAQLLADLEGGRILQLVELDQLGRSRAVPLGDRRQRVAFANGGVGRASGLGWLPGRSRFGRRCRGGFSVSSRLGRFDHGLGREGGLRLELAVLGFQRADLSFHLRAATLEELQLGFGIRQRGGAKQCGEERKCSHDGQRNFKNSDPKQEKFNKA